MNELCPFDVKEAEDGDEVRVNRVLIAPGGSQMKMVMKGGKAYVERITLLTNQKKSRKEVS